MAGANEYPKSDSSGNHHTFQYDYEEEKELGTAVTAAVASVTGSPVADVGQSLTESVDTDGLDRLFRPNLENRSSTIERVVLRVDGCYVTITSDGRITVEP